MVTIIPTYTAGTMPLIQTYFACMERHDAGCSYTMKMYTDMAGKEEVESLCKEKGVEVFGVDLPTEMTGTPKHARLLDAAIKKEDGLVLTMDSDCLPVADGWLAELVEFHEQGAVLSGILWPWEPPPKELPRDTIDYRVRKNHNWTNTWVACQLVSALWVKKHDLLYANGDDTGFELAEKAKELGLGMKGWMATRCALPGQRGMGFDPEFNRIMCVVYGDKMLHIGGASGRAHQRILDPVGLYNEVVDRILCMKNADWVMEEGNNWRYTLEREAEVAELKMRIMHQEMLNYLRTHDRLFDPPGFRKSQS